MEIYQILISLLERPDSPKYYRELRDYYQKLGLENETEAITYLIERKFNNKDVFSVDDSNNSDE